MKPYHIAALIGLILIAVSASSCITETTETTFPDGRKEVVKKRYPAPVYADVAASLAESAIERQIYNDKP